MIAGASAFAPLTIPTGCVFLLDTNCYMDLDDVQVPPPRIFTPRERDLVWSHLEALAGAGRLKWIKQVRRELKRHHSAAFNRLVPYEPVIRMPNQDASLRAMLTGVLGRHPYLLSQDPKLDPADPWLVATAIQYGHMVVTDELGLIKGRGKRKRKGIPDACLAESLQCPTLRELAENLGWI